MVNSWNYSSILILFIFLVFPYTFNNESIKIGDRENWEASQFLFVQQWVFRDYNTFTMSNTPKPIRCLLVDDHDIVMGGFKDTVSALDDIELAGTASSGEQACEMYDPNLYDVVIMDISMAGMGGLGAVAQILKQYPDANIMMYSLHEQWEFIRQAIDHGAKGYVSKLDSLDNIAKGIRALASGRVHYSENVMHVMAKNITGNIKSSSPQDAPNGNESESDSDTNSTDPLAQLSPRLKQAFRLLARRVAIKQMATDMQCDEKTVRNYRSRIVDILGLDHFTDIPEFAEKNRLVAREW